MPEVGYGGVEFGRLSTLTVCVSCPSFWSTETQTWLELS